MTDALLWAFEYLYHMDKANACMHCAPVRFSPITFRLAETLSAYQRANEMVAEVMAHKGKYEEDPGR